MDERGTPHTRDNTQPVTDDEFTEGLIISIAVGTYYSLNAFLPYIFWLGWRRDDIAAIGDGAYETAWNLLYRLHFFIFVPMALTWPFTYLGSSVIVDFYDQANWYVGTLAAGSLYSLVFLTLIISALSLKETTRVTKGFIWMEALLYLAIEGLSWYVSIWEYPKAHR